MGTAGCAEAGLALRLDRDEDLMGADCAEFEGVELVLCWLLSLLVDLCLRRGLDSVFPMVFLRW